MSQSSNLPRALSSLFEHGTNLVYKPGQIIIRPQDDPSGIFYVESGFIKTYGLSKFGNQGLLIIRKAGEIFPFIWLLTQTHRKVYYEAIDSVQLKRIARSDFLRLIQSDRSVMDFLLAQAVELYRIHSERLINMQFKTARERVIYRLLSLNDRFGSGGDPTVIQAPLRHQDIADSINLSRETTTRVINRLTKQGYINREDGLIALINPQKLGSLLE